MSTKIKDDLIQEATKLLEGWARKKNLLPKGRKLLVTMSIEDSELVSLKMEDKTASARFDEILAQPVKTLKLTVRAQNCIENGCLYLIGDLVRKAEDDLLKFRNFGNKSLREIRFKLEQLGLKIDMNIPVGPLEREAVLKGQIYPYVYHGAVRPLEVAGIMSIKDLLLRTEDEIVSILKDCDPKEIGEPRRVYHSFRESFRRRGLLP